MEKASFADIRKEISLIKQELEQRKEVSLLDEKIKAVQKKIDRFSTQDFSEKQKELLKTELHNVEKILQTYTKKYL
ncbi:MAG: hypothetical protein LBD75_02295 [Candidatus Peribacteria bacterium]|nr:hypothetical protein [Candidatus Peribacteria bacterium]